MSNYSADKGGEGKNPVTVEEHPRYKLLDRSIGFTLLLKKIIELWRPKAARDLVATDNGFFLIKFSSEYDYEYAMLGGPWMIFNHYLTVR